MKSRYATNPLALALALCLAHGAARADDAAPTAPDGASSTLDTISVIGKGETRQVQRVTQEEARIDPPGTSPLKVLAKLPGVHFESADPWGNYEWSARITLRGFNQQRLGFTLDGIPLGDMSYGNSNGLHISRAILSENLGTTELSQGIGALGTASTSNLGGAIQFYSSDPSTQYGVRLAQTVGSDATRRSFVRLDTGDHNGFSAYLSAGYGTTDKWKGSGDQKQSAFNAKLIYETGDTKLTLLANASRRDEVDYADLSLDSQRRLGWDWDNFDPNWQDAVDIANWYAAHPDKYATCDYPGGGNVCLDDAYYLGRGLRDDNLVGLSGDFGFGGGWDLHATAYYHGNRGQGHWFTPYTPSSATVPISIRTTEYGIDRTGLIAALSYEVDNQRFEGGFWDEDASHNAQRNFYFIDGPVDDSQFLHDPDIRNFYQHFDTTTRQLYLQDTLHFLDNALTLDIGAKSPRTETEATSLVGTRASGKLTAKKSLLPQFGVSYALGGGVEVFGSWAQNIAAFQPGVTGPFSATQAAFDAFGSSLKPEESKTLEGGLRATGDGYEASIAVYTVKFDNRLLNIARCVGIAGCASSFANVGSASSRGVELTFVWSPLEHLRWFNTLSFNRSRYDADYLDGTTLIPTDGKTVVDSPKQLFSSEIAWQDGPWDARIGAKYTGKRYITYLNDSSVPSYWLMDAAAGYEVGQVGPLENLHLSLNITNLADKKYFGTVGSNGFVVSDPQGYNWTVLTGAPRQVFFTADAKF